ncbi:MAG: VPS10 domain-containing protein [Vulcanimicrobiaceae bacterium]
MRRFICACLTLALALPALLTATTARAATSRSAVNPAWFAGLHWRLIGPFRGGRALAVTGVPGRPNRYYFGAVDGGVWETNNAGRTWTPIFDHEKIASIGAIAVAPSAPRTIYVGSGEADMRSNIAYGNGMYVSHNAGKTWQHIGLRKSKQIGSVVVDPHNADIAYVAALGNQYASNTTRGVFKTMNGGKTWSKVLYKNAKTGAIDLSMDPRNPNVLYAALWETRRPPWNVYPPSNGPGSGLYKTTDGGKTWTHLTAGLPLHVGRIGVAVSPADPQRVYAIVDSGPTHGGLYVSKNAGASWKLMDNHHRIWKRGWYFGGVTADPKNVNEVYVMDTSTYRSTDGGRSFTAIKGAPGGDDYHTLWVNPGNTSHMILGGDQGVVVSLDDAKTWSSWYNQPTGQFYHVITDNRFPYWLYGAQQDSGAVAVPSRSRHAFIEDRDWLPINAGSEDGYLAPDPLHPQLVFGDGLGAASVGVTVENIDLGWMQTIDPTLAYPSHTWRWDWTLPLIFSKSGKTLYFGNQRIFATTNGGSSWRMISPDLSRKKPAIPPNLDLSTIADNDGVSRPGVVYTIAPSPIAHGLIWAGTDDGNIWITHNGGKLWKKITPPQLTAWSKVTMIDASHANPNVAYAAIDRHRLNDYHPYIYRTADGGAHWKLISAGIPNGSFVNVVREDPRVPSLLYAGTERGMEVSFDTGKHWQPLQLNLPVSSVRDIALHGADVVIATHGRGLWIMDDASLLRQVAALRRAKNLFFAAPQAAYLLLPGSDEGTPLPLDEPLAKNPPNGAIFDYVVKHPLRTPLVITVRDAGGAVMRTWSSADKPVVINPHSLDIPMYWVHPKQPPSAGLGGHRFVWGMHTGSKDGPWALPGTYTVTMSANGHTHTHRVVLRKDPRIAATVADLQAQYAMAQAINTRIAQVTQLRKQAKLLLARRTLPPAQARILRLQIIGVTPSANPDNSVGTLPTDFTSLLFLSGAYTYLEGAVESAPVAPTIGMRTGLRKLDAVFAHTRARLAALR